MIGSGLDSCNVRDTHNVIDDNNFVDEHLDPGCVAEAVFKAIPGGEMSMVVALENQQGSPQGRQWKRQGSTFRPDRNIYENGWTAGRRFQGTDISAHSQWFRKIVL